MCVWGGGQYHYNTTPLSSGVMSCVWVCVVPVQDKSFRNQHRIQIVSVVAGDAEMLQRVSRVVIFYLRERVELSGEW